jgi:hypothetical protein
MSDLSDCDSDHYLVVPKVRDRLAVRKQMVKKMDMERFNLKQLNEVEVKEQCQVTIKNNFAALEYLDENGDMGHYYTEHLNFSQREYRYL